MELMSPRMEEVDSFFTLVWKKNLSHVTPESVKNSPCVKEGL